MEEYEESTGEELELDVVALCCDWSEYETALEAVLELSSHYSTDTETDEDEQESTALEYLQDQTQVIVFNGGILVESF